MIYIRDTSQIVIICVDIGIRVDDAIIYGNRFIIAVGMGNRTRTTSGTPDTEIAGMLDEVVAFEDGRVAAIRFALEHEVSVARWVKPRQFDLSVVYRQAANEFNFSTVIHFQAVGISTGASVIADGEIQLTVGGIANGFVGPGNVFNG